MNDHPTMTQGTTRLAPAGTLPGVGAVRPGVADVDVPVRGMASSPVDRETGGRVPASRPAGNPHDSRGAGSRPPATGAETGQTTAEYALVLLGAAALALALLAWATGTGRIGALFDAVLDRVLSGV